MLFFRFPTSAKWQSIICFLGNSVTGRWFSNLQQSSTELESEMFTPIKPLYYPSYLRSSCFHSSIYYALPQDHPVSSVCIQLPGFHHPSTLILQQTTFKKTVQRKIWMAQEKFQTGSSICQPLSSGIQMFTEHRVLHIFRCLRNDNSFWDWHLHTKTEKYIKNFWSMLWPSFVP